MPELPELEAFVIAQRDALTAEPIESVPVAHFATTKTIDPPLASLAGQRFTAVGRRAKRLLFTADGGDDDGAPHVGREARRRGQADEIVDARRRVSVGARSDHVRD